jgi:hypothetical protein
MEYVWIAVIAIIVIVALTLLSAFVFFKPTSNQNSTNLGDGEALITVNVIDRTIPVTIYLTAYSLTTMTINWGDGNVENVTVSPIEFSSNQFQFSHTYSNNGNYDIKLSNASSLRFLFNNDIGNPEILTNKITSLNLNKLTNLQSIALYSTSLTSFDITNLNKLYNLIVNKSKLTINSVNNILETFNSFGTFGNTQIDQGTIILNEQDPLAPPSGNGIIAKDDLISRFWDVQTD